MSFVVTTGNKQYLVKNGQIVIVDKISADINSVVELPVIHATGEAKTAKTIKATVMSHQKGEKIRVVKYKSKSRYHRQYGFRAHETVLKIEGTFEVPAGNKAGKSETKAEVTKKPATTKAPAEKAETAPKAAAKTTKPAAKKAPAKPDAKKTTK